MDIYKQRSMSEICQAILHYLNSSNFKWEPFSNICYASQQAIIFTYDNPFLTLHMLIYQAGLVARDKERRNATCDLGLSE